MDIIRNRAASLVMDKIDMIFAASLVLQQFITVRITVEWLKVGAYSFLIKETLAFIRGSIVVSYME